MGLLSKLLGRDKNTQTTTHDRPFVISNPVLGILNLKGAPGEALASADRAALSPLFADCRTSTDTAPKCHVLFIYCDIDAQGRIAGFTGRIRDIIRSAGAYVAVVASVNTPEAYTKALGPNDYWHANIVLIIDRNGDKFAGFYRRLFEMMHQGKSMLMAWVALAPQIPGHDHPDCPSGMMLADAGHLVFHRDR